MASGKTQVAAMLRDVGAVFSSTLLPQMAVHPSRAFVSLHVRFNSVADARQPTLVCQSQVLRSREVLLESSHMPAVDIPPDGLVRDIPYRQDALEDTLDVRFALVEAIQLGHRKANKTGEENEA